MFSSRLLIDVFNFQPINAFQLTFRPNELSIGRAMLANAICIRMHFLLKLLVGWFILLINPYKLLQFWSPSDTGSSFFLTTTSKVFAGEDSLCVHWCFIERAYYKALCVTLNVSKVHQQKFLKLWTSIVWRHLKGSQKPIDFPQASSRL